MTLRLTTPSTEPMSIPVPPDTVDLESLHRWALSLTRWLTNLHLEGLQATSMSQEQLDSMVSANDLTQSGKHFFNVTTGKPNFAEVDGDNLVIKVLATV